MREFWKGNKWIVIFLGMALLYSICYFVVSDKETILSMLYAVALSYIAAFIFYLLQVYFPENKKRNVINKIIKSRLNGIIIKINELYKEMFKLYIPQYNDETNVDLHMDKLLRFKFDDRTSICSVRRLDSLIRVKESTYKTLRELVQETIIVLKNNMDFLYKAFPNYLSHDVISVLEEMNNSLFLNVMSFNSQSLLPCDFTECEPNIFKDFWNLKNKLKKYNDII